MSAKDTSKNEGIAYIGLFSSIDQATAEELIDTLITKLPPKTHTVCIYLSTGGGSVSHGFVIYNFLRSLPCKLVMHNVGSVDSIGGVIFLAGEERYAVENGTFLIHRVESDFEDESTNGGKLEEKLCCVKVEEAKIKEVMIERSKLSKAEIEDLFEYGDLKRADFALEKGWIHAVRPVQFPKPEQWLLVKGSSKEGSKE